MHVSRRSVIALTTVFASCAVSTRIVGAHQAMAESADQEMARQLVSTLPETDYYDILLRLSEISTRGSTGESFNSRWRRTSNPLIGLFFQELGYRSAAYDNCVPWCAVALAWCLKRDGRRLPPNPARSQSYLHYGTPVTEPRRGDICIFTEVDNPAEGHVGLFSGFVDGDKISVLGGNQKGDEETNCGPGFPKSYITFEDVEINAVRRKTDNGLYLRAIRRPPERGRMVMARQGPFHPAATPHAAEPPAALPPAPASPPILARATTPVEGHRVSLAGLPVGGPDKGARSAGWARVVAQTSGLLPHTGHVVGALSLGLAGFGWYRASGHLREARRTLRAQLETGAQRELQAVERLLPGGTVPSPAYAAEVKAFAIYLATAFKQTEIPKIRKANVPAEVRRRLDLLTTSAPSQPWILHRLLALNLAMVRLLNHVETSTRRTDAYRALYDGEVTPALRDLLAVLVVELTPDEHRLVIDAPVHDRSRWYRALLPAGRRVRPVAAPAGLST
jgi:uncharacterized protein (TIGR02594 family)